MTLEQAYFVSQIVGGIVLIVSILFLALQMRQNSKLMQRTLTEDRRSHRNWLYEQISTSSEFADFHKRIGTDYESLSEIEKYRANWLAEKGLAAVLNTVQAKIDGEASEHEWLDTENNLKFFAKRKNVQVAWEKLKPGYSTQIRELFEKTANW